MDGEEDTAIKFFMNSFSAFYTFTVLKLEVILMMRTYYNNNQNLNQLMNQETVFHQLHKNSIFNSLNVFFVTGPFQHDVCDI